MRIISIEGNIGSGKSTILELLKIQYNYENNEIIFIDEPLDVWINIKDNEGKNMLEKYYENQDKYAFSFQMMAYISKLEKLINAISSNQALKILSYEKEEPSCHELIFISERSLYTDSLVFAKMLYDNGKIEEVNYQIYLKWFDFFITNQSIPLHNFIFINTSPEKCLERIIKRNRNGEQIIPLDYLITCHNYHLNMMEQMKLKNSSILIIDGNIDITQNNINIQNKWLDNIRLFILSPSTFST